MDHLKEINKKLKQWDSAIATVVVILVAILIGQFLILIKID